MWRMQEFTNPLNGPMNLATHLPKHFVPPDLGPKSYIAYGSTEQKPPHDSVTRIHEDLCDAINILLYSAHDAELRPADVPAPAVELALPLAERTVGASPLSLVAHRSPFSPQRRWRASERRHPTGRKRIDSPTLQTLQYPILLLPWACFRGGFPNRTSARSSHSPSHWSSWAYVYVSVRWQRLT